MGTETAVEQRATPGESGRPLSVLQVLHRERLGRLRRSLAEGAAARRYLGCLPGLPGDPESAGFVSRFTGPTLQGAARIVGSGPVPHAAALFAATPGESVFLLLDAKGGPGAPMLLQTAAFLFRKRASEASDRPFDGNGFLEDLQELLDSTGDSSAVISLALGSVIERRPRAVVWTFGCDGLFLAKPDGTVEPIKFQTGPAFSPGLGFLRRISEKEPRTIPLHLGDRILLHVGDMVGAADGILRRGVEPAPIPASPDDAGTLDRLESTVRLATAGLSASLLKAAGWIDPRNPEAGWPDSTIVVDRDLLKTASEFADLPESVVKESGPSPIPGYALGTAPRPGRLDGVFAAVTLTGW